jgi:hypothetical protein
VCLGHFCGNGPEFAFPLASLRAGNAQGQQQGPLSRMNQGVPVIKDREAYESKLEALLVRWELELKALKTDIETRVDASKSQAVDALQHKFSEAAMHLRKLKTANDDVWESERAAVDKAWAWW